MVRCLMSSSKRSSARAPSTACPRPICRSAGASIRIAAASTPARTASPAAPTRSSATTRPQKRLEAMQRLADRGIRCGVLLAPVLPGLTDDPQSMRDVVEAAAEHGASFVHDNVLYLRPGTKEWFMPFLREAYPHLAERYAKYYRGAHTPTTYTQDLHRTITATPNHHALTHPTH